METPDCRRDPETLANQPEAQAQQAGADRPAAEPDGCTGPHAQKSPAAPEPPKHQHPMHPPIPHARCGAKTRQGGPCPNPAMANGRCRMHGGKSLAGIASGTYRHGNRSRYLKNLPREWQASYRAALADPELTSLRGELAVQGEMIAELLRQLSEGEAPPWGKAAEALAEFEAAVAGKDTERFRVSLAALRQVIHTGAGAAAQQAEMWDQLLAVIGQKTRTAAAEWKRMAGLKALVTVEQAMQLWRALLMAAREVVTDPDQLRRLQERALKLLPPDN
jgi:hypothetical protein